MYVNPDRTERLEIMVRKTKQESLETRQQLLDAAVKIFAAQGVSKSSLNDIATAAGVTRGAIYWHFKNKVDIFDGLCRQMQNDIDKMEAEYLKQFPDNPLHTFRSLLIHVLQLTAVDPDHRALMEIIFHKCEFVGDMIPLRDVRQSLSLEGHERLEIILRKCIQCQQLPVTLDVNMASVMLRGYMCGLMENWLFSPDSFDLENDAPLLVDAFIDMLRLSPLLHRSATPPSRKAT